VRLAVLVLVLMTASCRKDQPPAPTPEQSSQLNDADSMLNNVANEVGPEDRSSGPSNSSD